MKSKRLLLPVLAAMAMALTFGAFASAAETEESKDWMFHDIVDMAFVKPYVTVPAPENVMLIDSRPRQGKFDKGHIPTAVNIPDSQFDKMTDMLPKDKGTLLIFYCEGLKCKLSHNSAKKAEALGYTNVKVYAEGFPGWMEDPGHYAVISTDHLKKLMDEKTDMVLVDSRPKMAKYEKGHIPGAVNIPDSEFDKLKDQLPQDKEKPLVFYCEGHKCKLSHSSAAKAIALGYKKVQVYSAGYPEWKEKFGEGQVAEKEAAGSKTEIKKGKEEGSIDIVTFEKILAEKPESVLLVDVRDADEYKAATLKTAVNIPVAELEKKAKTLTSEKPIVFICGTGARSGESYYMMKDLRPDLKEVYYLEAELTINKDGSFKIKKN